jgi:23S rRNA pseudouridine1911/1915/1917 synthase
VTSPNRSHDSDGRTTVVVSDAVAGERLDRAIAALAPTVSRGEARRLIAAGVVFVAGRRTGISSRLVRAGEQIAWQQPARLRPPGSIPDPRIVLERADLWIIDKPAGMPVEPTRSGSLGTLTEWLKHGHGPAFVTHRLDAATSGLLVVARDRETQVALNDLFARHAVGRRYLAIVAPPPVWETTTLSEELDGRPAVTRVRVTARAPAAAAVVVDLETGRTRQIRRHLAGAGSPVVGEDVTGARTNARLLLHAFALTLPWPAGGGTLSFTASPPPAWTADAAVLGLTADAAALGLTADAAVLD